MASALLVLDMLTDFTSGKLANPAAQQIIEPVAALARAARGRDDWVVVYGNDAHGPATSSRPSSGSTPWPALPAPPSSPSWPPSPVI
jgi:nicotinamidase-related amidase